MGQGQFVYHSVDEAGEPVIDVAGDAVDDAADRDADPQRTTAMPAAQVAAGAVGQRSQRLGLRTARAFALPVPPL